MVKPTYNIFLEICQHTLLLYLNIIKETGSGYGERERSRREFNEHVREIKGLKISLIYIIIADQSYCTLHNNKVNLPLSIK